MTKGYMLTLFPASKIIEVNPRGDIPKYSVEVVNDIHDSLVRRWISPERIDVYLKRKKEQGWKIEDYRKKDAKGGKKE